MIYFIKFNNQSLLKTIEDLFLLFFPNQQIKDWYPGENCHFEINYTENSKIIVEAISDNKEYVKVTEIGQNNGEKSNNQVRRLVRLAFYKLLLQIFKEPPKPWGIMTGVRPTKVVHRLLEQGYSFLELNEKLFKDYYVTEEKVRLLEEITRYQRNIFDMINTRRGVCIYISIPFCPSRCLYCSFPAYELLKYEARIDKYLSDLKNELGMFVKYIKNNNITVEAIYIGGGTPTVLSAEKLEDLFISIKPFITNNLKEFTLEAGRPDTINEDKIKIAKKYGVTRISVNPQSMQEKTLKNIGRCHSVKQVIDAVKMVQRYGFKLNMDLIMGLPGENSVMYEDTVDKVLKLKPQNITIHTLAIKSSSKLRKIEVILPQKEEVLKMYNISNKKLREYGYKPYYLYRQKRILADLENIGYTMPLEESWYNIMMMEERQTIIGFGSGASSKFIDPTTNEIIALYFNPKDPIIYGQRERIITDKINLLDNIFNL